MTLFFGGGRVWGPNPEAATGSQLLVYRRWSLAAFWLVPGVRPDSVRLNILGGLPRNKSLWVFLFLSPLFPALAFKLCLLAALPLSLPLVKCLVAFCQLRSSRQVAQDKNTASPKEEKEPDHPGPAPGSA